MILTSFKQEFTTLKLNSSLLEILESVTCPNKFASR